MFLTYNSTDVSTSRLRVGGPGGVHGPSPSAPALSPPCRPHRGPDRPQRVKEWKDTAKQVLCLHEDGPQTSRLNHGNSEHLAARSDGEEPGAETPARPLSPAESCGGQLAPLLCHPTENVPTQNGGSRGRRAPRRAGPAQVPRASPWGPSDEEATHCLKKLPGAEAPSLGHSVPRPIPYHPGQSPFTISGTV